MTTFPIEAHYFSLRRVVEARTGINLALLSRNLIDTRVNTVMLEHINQPESTSVLNDRSADLIYEATASELNESIIRANQIRHIERSPFSQIEPNEALPTILKRVDDYIRELIEALPQQDQGALASTQVYNQHLLLHTSFDTLQIKMNFNLINFLCHLKTSLNELERTIRQNNPSSTHSILIQSRAARGLINNCSHELISQFRASESPPGPFSYPDNLQSIILETQLSIGNTQSALWQMVEQINGDIARINSLQQSPRLSSVFMSAYSRNVAFISRFRPAFIQLDRARTRLQEVLANHNYRQTSQLVRKTDAIASINFETNSRISSTIMRTNSAREAEQAAAMAEMNRAISECNKIFPLSPLETCVLPLLTNQPGTRAVTIELDYIDRLLDFISDETSTTHFTTSNFTSLATIVMNHHSRLFSFFSEISLYITHFYEIDQLLPMILNNPQVNATAVATLTHRANQMVIELHAKIASLTALNIQHSDDIIDFSSFITDETALSPIVIGIRDTINSMNELIGEQNRYLNQQKEITAQLNSLIEARIAAPAPTLPMPQTITARIQILLTRSAILLPHALLSRRQLRSVYANPKPAPAA